MTVFARSFSVFHPDEETMAGRLAEEIRGQAEGSNLRGIFLFSGVGFDIPRFRVAFSREFPRVPMLGTTSCRGTGSETGFHPAPQVSALAFYGEGFRIGTAFVDRAGKDAFEVGRLLAEKATTGAGISPDKTRFAFLFCSLGEEPAILDGIYGSLPADMPILGGGAADNDLSGQWYTWNEKHHGQSAAALAVCDWPWDLAAHFESGYLAAGPKGRATSVTGGRILNTIDGRPAAEVYNEWTAGSIAGKLDGGTILSETTLNPLGVAKMGEGGFRTFFLIHPAEVLPDRSMKLFASIDEGEELHLMFTRKASLLNRTNRLAKNALGSHTFGADEVVASVLIYCAGCLSAVHQQADDLLTSYRQVSDAPFIAGFTYGEMGCVLPLVYGHGNLMAGTLLLSDAERTA